MVGWWVSRGEGEGLLRARDGVKGVLLSLAYSDFRYITVSHIWNSSFPYLGITSHSFESPDAVMLWNADAVCRMLYPAIESHCMGSMKF